MNEYTKLIISLINEYVNEKRYSFEFVKETCELLLEMKSKEEYRKDKVFGGKSKDNPYFKLNYGDETEGNIKGVDVKQKDVYADKLKKYIHDKTVGDEVGDPPKKPKDYKSTSIPKSNKGTLTVNGKKYNIKINNRDTSSYTNKDYGISEINLNKDVFKHHNAKEIASMVSHELGHKLTDNTRPKDSVVSKIEDTLGKKGEKISKHNHHTSSNELQADMNSVKNVGAKDSIKALRSLSKETHRKVEKPDKKDFDKIKDNMRNHEAIDQDIALRTKFMKSLDDNDLK